MSIFSKIQHAEKLSPRLRNLYLHKIIRNSGVGLLTMFGPIFFYVLGGSFRFVLIFYTALYLIYFLFLPLWAKILKYASLHIFMIIGSLFTIISYALLYFISQNQNFIWASIILLALLFAAEKLFYWTPYHIDLARFMNKHRRGRQFSFLAIFITLLAIIIPIFSGFIISKFGYPVLFILVMVVVLISILPIFFIPHTRERFTFGYFETFKKIFSKNHLKSNLAYFADGFQSGIGIIIWPVFIFILLKGQYLQVGLISAAIVLATCVLQYAMGEATDRFDKKKIMRAGSALYALGWVFKAIVASGWHIFLAGTYHNFTRVLMRTPFDVLMYEIAADEGHYIDEFTVCRELSLLMGRIFMFILALVMLNFVSIIWIFILGGLISLLINLISKEEFAFKNP